MTRRTADHRFDDLPDDVPWPPRGAAMGEAITALAHAGRRRLLDELTLNGPAPVGALARATGMAAGSASHHLRVLARAGFIVAAPELAGDTRQSWWRATRRTLRWSDDAFAPGSAGWELGQLAGRANLDYLLDAARRWQRSPDQAGWDGTVSDVLTQATQNQCADLGTRLAEVISQWARECAQDQELHPDHERRPVRAVALTFPETVPDDRP